MSERYHGLFADRDDACQQWGSPAGFPEDSEILFAEYEYEDYSGSASLYYLRDGQLFENHDSHCSCYGLECWSPEPTTKDAILMRPGLPEALVRALGAL